MDSRVILDRERVLLRGLLTEVPKSGACQGANAAGADNVLTAQGTSRGCPHQRPSRPAALLAGCSACMQAARNRLLERTQQPSARKASAGPSGDHRLS